MRLIYRSTGQIADRCQILHVNEIFHADVKPENVLILNSSQGTSENWTAKLCDFSHSRLNVYRKINPYLRPDIIGTEQYCPPELVPPEARVSPSNLKAIDIWCWGMLLWYTLVNGKAYATVSGGDITKEQMQEFKQSGLMNNIAVEYCQQMLYEEQHDPQLIATILDSLSGSLQLDPTRRPSSESLLDGIVHQLNLEPRHISTFKPLETEQSLPSFDVSASISGA